MKWVNIIAIIFLMGCSPHEKDYAKFVEEIVGKEISFSDSIITINGVISELPVTDFTILSYYDSNGCTSCRMKMTKWNKFMREIDSIRNDITIQLILVAETEQTKQLDIIAQQNNFHHSIAIEKDDTFADVNNIPKDPKLQCFLLNSKHEVLLIGNPIDNPAIWKLYTTEITGTEVDTNKSKSYTYDFGNIEPNQEVTHIFRLINTSKDTLQLKELVSSCYCTKGKITKKSIGPNESYQVGVSFKDTISGDFSRTVTALFNNSHEIEFEIIGSIR